MPYLSTLAYATAKAYGFNSFQAKAEAGQQDFITPGTYSWVAPSGVTSVSVVCIGAGGGIDSAGVPGCAGSGGGGLGWKNNIAVSPGSSYTVVVGAGVTAGSGENSSFNGSTVVGNGGSKHVARTGGNGGGYTGDGGGNGGNGSSTSTTNGGGGGGAGGYSGNGGNGGADGIQNASQRGGGGGGGVGILGEGSNGAGGVPGATASGGTAGSGGGGGGGAGGDANAPGGGGGGGSGGGSGATGALFNAAPALGGLYGGGSGGVGNGGGGTNAGRNGAVRIIWAGTSGVTRAFPSTNTGNL